jgi:hypothetical protein
MQTITLTYEHRTAALASSERFWLAAHIQALPASDPTKNLGNTIELPLLEHGRPTATAQTHVTTRPRASAISLLVGGWLASWRSIWGRERRGSEGRR